MTESEGDRLIMEPVRKGRLLALLAALEPLEERFPDIDEDAALLAAASTSVSAEPAPDSAK